jgi:hypothetical protein
MSLIFLQALGWNSELSFKSARVDSTILPLRASVEIFVPVVLVTQVFPKLLVEKGTGALKSNHSFLESGSATFFLPPPFLPPLENL